MLSQIDTLNNINSRLSNAASKTNVARSKQLEFKIWYANLEWYEKHINPETLQRAERYESLFKAANELDETADAFGAESDMPIIRRGSKGPAVRRWQGVLGLAGKDADGDFGPTTERLTKEWQKKNGMKQDGIVGNESWAKAVGQQIKDAIQAVPSSQKSLSQMLAEQKTITAAQLRAVNPNIVYSSTGQPTTLTASGQPVLQQGSKGPEVNRWQKIIGADADGNFGPQTKTLTIAWQKRNGLLADGVVDDPDWAAATVAPKTNVADLKAAVPALKKAQAELPEKITPASTKTKAKVTAAANAVKAGAENAKNKVQNMPLWQRVLTGAAVTGCAILGFQAISQKFSASRSTAQMTRLLNP